MLCDVPWMHVCVLVFEYFVYDLHGLHRTDPLNVNAALPLPKANVHSLSL